MSEGWFTFCLVAAIILCSGCVLAAAIMRTVAIQRQREALITDNLRALEESTVFLIEQLRSETERMIAEVEQRREVLAELIAEFDKRLSVIARK
ncbi:MAG: hypothetical protein QHH26_08150 [Armatimonadota bacterium]|nr:hypothetical protein [Armatimonadota bacterium]